MATTPPSAVSRLPRLPMSLGKPVVQAEAFTAEKSEGWKLHPGAIKDQGDWAFATGVNKFFYHTFAHQPLDEKLNRHDHGAVRGALGPEPNLVADVQSLPHLYCPLLLSLAAGSAYCGHPLPHTRRGLRTFFRPPLSSMGGNDTLPDRRGYNFDGVSPGLLIEKATVKDHKIIFPGGGSYQLLVLPLIETMTPELLNKIESLVRDGANVAGIPPKKSPSLVNYPLCDKEVNSICIKIMEKLYPAGESCRPYPTAREGSIGAAASR